MYYIIYIYIYIYILSNLISYIKSIILSPGLYYNDFLEAHALGHMMYVMYTKHRHIRICTLHLFNRYKFYQVLYYISNL